MFGRDIKNVKKKRRENYPATIIFKLQFRQKLLKVHRGIYP